MDTQRARDIIKSSETIQVLYHGTPVWIESVTNNNTAQITYIDNHKREEVPVYKLIENNSITE